MGRRGCESGIKGIEREGVPQIGEEQHSCCVRLIFRDETAGRCKLRVLEREVLYKGGK